MEKANTADCIVIYGGTQEERQHIAERMIRDHPELGSENNPVFSRTVKIGPFTKENKKSMCQIFLDSPLVKSKYKDSLLDLFGILGVTEYMDRPIRGLSAMQLKRFSLLYDFLHGKKRVLLCDKDHYDTEVYYRIAACLSYLTDDGQIIWVTEMSYADFLRTSTEYIHSWWENTCKGDAHMRAINHKVLLGLPHFGKRMKVAGDYLEPDPALECDETEAALEYQRELGWIEILRLRS